jgi:excisionase family DNA binding protein
VRVKKRVKSTKQKGVADWSSPDEAAERLNVSRATVWRMMKNGVLRYVQVSERVRRIPPTEFERLAMKVVK